MERPLGYGGSTDETRNSSPIGDCKFSAEKLAHADRRIEASYRAPAANEIRKNYPIPTRKRKKSSRAIGPNPKLIATGVQCHVRPLRTDQIGLVPDNLRLWFHNQVRCDPIPPELYRGMFKMVGGKEFCAIRGCTFETTASRRRRGLKYEHANRHLNHKPFYCPEW
jgi:hypothetical protein